jgi:hypothetical protein
MKKIIFPLGIVALSLVSCKKDYTCSCTYTTTETEDGTSTSETSTSKIVFTDVKKSFVEDKVECYSTSSSYTYESWTGSQVTVKNDADCSID